MTDVRIRRGHSGDAHVLRRIFSAASEGIADYFWEKSRETDQTIDEVARARMYAKIADPENSLWIAVVDGKSAGGLLAYEIEHEEPLDGLSPMIQSFVAFENDAVGTYYINVLAVFPEYRRLGIGSKLIARAREEAGRRNLSLAVSDENQAARATYAANGFDCKGAYPMVKEDWQGHGENWLLMIKPAA